MSKTHYDSPPSGRGWGRDALSASKSLSRIFRFPSPNPSRREGHYIALCITLLCLCLLSACGKKASVMEAPEGADPNAYPRTYPDVTTDPEGVYILPKQLEK